MEMLDGIIMIVMLLILLYVVYELLKMVRYLADLIKSDSLGEFKVYNGGKEAKKDEEVMEEPDLMAYEDLDQSGFESMIRKQINGYSSDE